jgi:hypothetical protein
VRRFSDDLEVFLCQQSRLQRLLILCIDAGVQSGLGSGTLLVVSILELE